MHQDNVAHFISHDYINITYRTNTWWYRDLTFLQKIVRLQALCTLGPLYRRITDGEYPSMMRKAEWLANTLMHLYVAPHDVNIYM